MKNKILKTLAILGVASLSLGLASCSVSESKPNTPPQVEQGGQNDNTNNENNNNNNNGGGEVITAPQEMIIPIKSVTEVVPDASYITKPDDNGINKFIHKHVNPNFEWFEPLDRELYNWDYLGDWRKNIVIDDTMAFVNVTIPVKKWYVKNPNGSHPGEKYGQKVEYILNLKLDCTSVKDGIDFKVERPKRLIVDNLFQHNHLENVLKRAVINVTNGLGEAYDKKDYKMTITNRSELNTDGLYTLLPGNHVIQLAFEHKYTGLVCTTDLEVMVIDAASQQQ